MASPTVPIPAATLIAMRNRVDGPPDLLMVERAATLRFAGGALVFPGGRIDPGDRSLADAMPGDADDMAARIAAIRETIEETGVAIGVSPLPGREQLADWRTRLARGERFGDLVAHGNFKLDLDRLVAFARWCPDLPHAHVFDTRFYIARVTDALPDPIADGTETARAFWTSAQGVLDAADRGEARIIFPTRRTLERLARHENVAQAMADAAMHPVRTITPWTEQHGDRTHLCIPDDLGFPVTREALDSVRRG